MILGSAQRFSFPWVRADSRGAKVQWNLLDFSRYNEPVESCGVLAALTEGLWIADCLEPRYSVTSRNLPKFTRLLTRLKKRMPRFSVGHRFPAQEIRLAPEKVQQYLVAVGSESPLYHDDSDLTPPLAIAAWVLAGLIEAIGLPPGSVHATQEFAFMDSAAIGSTIDAEAEVVQAAVRAGMDVIVVEIRAAHAGRPVLSGRSMLMMPTSEE